MKYLKLFGVASLFLALTGQAMAQYPRPLDRGRMGTSPPPAFVPSKPFNAVNNASRYTGMQLDSRTTGSLSTSGLTFERRSGGNTTTQLDIGRVSPFGSSNRTFYGAAFGHKF